MATDYEIIKHMADLAALSIGENELEAYAQELKPIIGLMDEIKEIDSDGINPMQHGVPLYNVLREDVVSNEDRREELISCTEVSENGCYVVPSTVESL